MQRPIPCLFMRGGTSHGPFFRADDLPADVATRDRVLLAVMGSPDARQIDGIGGADPLTSKVGIVFLDTAGSVCGALFPTGNRLDVFDGIDVTCIDNGMPVVVMLAADLGVSGYESRDELNANAALKRRIESIRLQAGPAMKLGD